MSREKGSKSTVLIPLETLTRVLADFPKVKIAVGKGSIAALETALGVDFGLTPEVETEAPETAETAEGSAERAVVKVS